MNTISLESLTGALAYAMGITPPEHAAAANEDLTAYVDKALAGAKADRIFMYNTDAIGQWMYKKQMGTTPAEYKKQAQKKI